MWRESIELDKASHDAPIPAACRVGPLVITSGIAGRSATTGELGVDLDEQTRIAFDNLALAFERAGGSMSDVARVTVLMRSRRERDVLNRHWEGWFGDPASRPARHVQEMELPGAVLIQLEATGFVDDHREG
jgi:2-iminobutanoate/2-iminopropanoate deaminase